MQNAILVHIFSILRILGIASKKDTLKVGQLLLIQLIL